MENSRKKILVVDDEPDFTTLLKLALEEAGAYDVLAENDAEHTLDAARQFQPDLVILDVMMPRLDGGDVAGLLRADEDLHDVPILLLTAGVTSNDWVMESPDDQRFRVLAKPLETARLVEAIEQEIGSGARAGGDIPAAKGD
jgi:two-component system alkaline phosphatase synthesis response regulator PhoP